MGGQACVFYGAAEFSRDVDLLVEESDDALERLLGALRELQAERIAVPPFRREHLEQGLAVHFRCHHPEAAGIRIDIMSRLRGLDGFTTLWARRTTVNETFDLLSLPDLVQAKKTQRDKDWPMLRRLVEAHYFQHCEGPKARPGGPSRGRPSGPGPVPALLPPGLAACGVPSDAWSRAQRSPTASSWRARVLSSHGKRRSAS